MERKHLMLAVLPEVLSVCRLAPKDSIPEWALRGTFFSVSRTSEELSIVCEQSAVPSGTKCEQDWRCFRIVGAQDFGLIGILASIANCLSNAGIALFVLSTFDTDYVLVKKESLKKAVAALSVAGNKFTNPVMY